MMIKKIESGFQDIEQYQVGEKSYKVEKFPDGSYHTFEDIGNAWMHCFRTTDVSSYKEALDQYLDYERENLDEEF